jgi:hypothetical protein
MFLRRLRSAVMVLLRRRRRGRRLRARTRRTDSGEARKKNDHHQTRAEDTTIHTPLLKTTTDLVAESASDPKR